MPPVMLSVLVPTYNYDCTALVKRLAKEVAELSVAVEILVADDCSTDNEVRQANASLDDVEGCRVFMRTQNGGRAATRNFLAQQAQYSHLLFLDADGMPANSAFLSVYVEAVGKEKP